jgi:type III secretory pathway component EscS
MGKVFSWLALAALALFFLWSATPIDIACAVGIYAVLTVVQSQKENKKSSCEINKKLDELKNELDMLKHFVDHRTR